MSIVIGGNYTVETDIWEGTFTSTLGSGSGVAVQNMPANGVVRSFPRPPVSHCLGLQVSLDAAETKWWQWMTAALPVQVVP